MWESMASDDRSWVLNINITSVPDSRAMTYNTSTISNAAWHMAAVDRSPPGELT